MLEWLTANWSNIVAIVQALGTIVAAISVIVLIFQVKVNQKQVRLAIDTSYDSHRPLLVAVQTLRTYEPPGIPIDYKTQMIKLRNVGSGLATNIVCVSFPSASRKGEPYTLTRFIDPIMQGEKMDNIGLSPEKNGKPFLSDAKRLDKRYSFFASEDTAARYSITYHDIFGRKHASIVEFFDQWTSRNVAFLPNIELDLEDLRRESISPTAT